MRLIVLAEDFYPNTSGGALTRWRFCKRTVERGHDVTVFTPRRPGTERSECVDGVQIERPFRAKPKSLPAFASIAIVPRLIYTALLFGYLLFWFSREDADGIHVASQSLHWVGKLLSVVFDLPLVSFVGLTPSARSEFRPNVEFFLERLNFRLFMGSAVFCRLPDVRDVIARYVEGRVEIVHGILHRSALSSVPARADRTEVRSRYGLDEDDRLLVFAGRLVPIKDPTKVVEILARLPDKYHLVIVGDGPERARVEDAIETGGLGDRVTMTGTLSHDETLEIVAAGDGLLLTSQTESYSAAAIEGLVLGCHVFSTPVGVLPDIEHERLHLDSTDSIPARIRETDLRPTAGVDEATLDAYSMDRYTETILSGFDTITRDDTPRPESGAD